MALPDILNSMGTNKKTPGFEAMGCNSADTQHKTVSGALPNSCLSGRNTEIM